MNSKFFKFLEEEHQIIFGKPKKNTFIATAVLSADKTLQSLNLNKCNLKNLDFLHLFAKELQSISKLELSGNDITDINAIGNLINLRSLDISGNKIKDLSALETCTKLNTLDLSNNFLTDLAPLKSLTLLSSLNIAVNTNIVDLSPLTKLPLIKLNSSQNPFQDLAIINNFSKLKKLTLQTCNIVDNDFLKDLKPLVFLDLGGNLIQNIDSIANLVNLETLDLNHNKITDIGCLKNLRKLTRLEIRGNKVSDISSLLYLENLINLNLGSNTIKDFTKIQKLINLERLFLDQNGKADFTPIKHLISLTNLSLEDNEISDIGFLSDLKNLQAIWVARNNINNIESLKNLDKLDSIDLRYNPIKILPEWITRFDIPIKWDDSVERGVIMFFNNPIEEPPIQILKSGLDATKRYFTKIEQQGIDFIYEAKLTLVGEGSAGKTSLKERLLDGKALLPKRDTRTRGIRIQDWTFKVHARKNFVAHIWDFGGQDVYYPVHRFFLTENSVFVLLASTRNTHHNFDYWIPTIYQFGDKSPIILGQTCHDGNKVSWNDLDYYIGNPNFNIIKTQLLPYFELNLPKRNEGLIKIKQTIINQIISLPHYGRGVPKTWLIVRNSVAKQAKRNPCITFESFREICLDASSSGFEQLIDIQDCAKFLHSLGVILWYYNQDNLKDWVILQPDWSMNAVYKIIDDEKIQKRRGNILPEDFDRLWKDSAYLGKHVILKKMLEVFKIAFPKKHKRSEYIIPARLLSMPEEFRWKNDFPCLKLTYSFQFMPKGLVNQVTAELSRFITNEEQVWNNGVNLSNENKSAECQIIEDFYSREISIKAKGRDARGLIMVVMNALKDIIDEYKGVKTEIHVPCICETCLQSNTPYIFPYNDLLRWYEKREGAKVTCNESHEIISIDDLLYNVGLPAPMKKTTQNKMNKTIKIFLASSSELKSERDQFEIFIGRKNKEFNKIGIFIELNLWEDFIDSVSQTRLQDEYNKAVIESDILVSLFFTKVGKYTTEEFENALKSFNSTGKPKIFTFFKNVQINIGDINEKDFLSKIEFEKRLKAIGHFPTIFTSTEDLLLRFNNQLAKILTETSNAKS